MLKCGEDEKSWSFLSFGAASKAREEARRILKYVPYMLKSAD